MFFLISLANAYLSSTLHPSLLVCNYTSQQPNIYPSSVSSTVLLSCTLLSALPSKTSQSLTIQFMITRQLLTNRLYHQSVIIYPQSNCFYHPHHHYHLLPFNHQLQSKHHHHLYHQSIHYNPTMY